ncbi:hypothetical protein EON65_47665, partial [archaeon]
MHGPSESGKTTVLRALLSLPALSATLHPILIDCRGINTEASICQCVYTRVRHAIQKGASALSNKIPKLNNRSPLSDVQGLTKALSVLLGDSVGEG